MTQPSIRVVSFDSQRLRAARLPVERRVPWDPVATTVWAESVGVAYQLPDPIPHRAGCVPLAERPGLGGACGQRRG